MDEMITANGYVLWEWEEQNKDLQTIFSLYNSLSNIPFAFLEDRIRARRLLYYHMIELNYYMLDWDNDQGKKYGFDYFRTIPKDECRVFWYKKEWPLCCDQWVAVTYHPATDHIYNSMERIEVYNEEGLMCVRCTDADIEANGESFYKFEQER